MASKGSCFSCIVLVSVIVIGHSQTQYSSNLLSDKLITLLALNSSSTNPVNVILNFTQIARKYGYNSEEHTAITEDGYILTIFRIRGRRCRGKLNEPPVILMHGLLLSSDCWLDAGPEAGLGFLIADACHDLWVGNQRGNYYSRRHMTLNPDKDQEFWSFSVDEIGLYDIPATIDYVLDYTGAAQLNYVGYSQGSGTFYIMCSERPEYCEKARVLISLAPAARQTYCTAVGFRGVTQLLEDLRLPLAKLGIYEVFQIGGPTQATLHSLCQFTLFYDFCIQALAIFDALDPGSIAVDTVQVLFNHFPGGTSVQNMARYGQSSRSEHFEKFDYGRVQNLRVYGSVYPPKYNLSAVTIPVVVIYGNNDGIEDPRDIKWLIGELPNVEYVEEVRNPLWTHFDVAYSQFTVDLIFPTISKYLTKYST